MTFYEVISQLTVRNMVDIAIVAFFLYQIISMMRGTRAAQVVTGLLVIFIAYAASSLFELETLNWIISKFYASFIIVVIVLFQDDIRRLLTRFGRGPFVSGLEEGSGLIVIEEVVTAARNLSHERLGALMVFERGVGLERLYDHSVRLDAMVSEQLLLSIFQSFSPLHDGAVIVQKNKILCASAHLPLSKSPGQGKKMGTRHSAAVGISEQTDAVVVVVSEETGAISIAVNGELQRQHSPEATKKRLTQLLLPQAKKSSVQMLLGERIFRTININFLKIKSLLKRAYSGSEKRQKTTDRRYQQSMNWTGSVDSLHAVERENRLASSEVRMNLRFPGSVSKGGVFNTKGHSLVFSSQTSLTGEASEEKELTNAQTNLSDSNTNNEELSPSDEEFTNTYQTGEINAIEQNEAAANLNQMRPEDRLIPPDVPQPPPRDVSIGGISLNPPMEVDKKRDKQ